MSEKVLGEIQVEEIKKLAMPLQEWLTSNYNPMCSIVIELDRISVISSDLSIPTQIDEN